MNTLRTRYEHGQLATFESHYPSMDSWSGYTFNHSEHYLHLTYVDNVFTNLFGIIHSLSNTFEIRLLELELFAVEHL